MVGVAARLPGRRGRASSWRSAARHGRPARAFRHAYLRLQRCDRPRSVQAAVGGDLSGQRGAASGRRRRRHPRGGRKPWSPRSPPLHPGRGPPSPRPAPGPRDARPGTSAARPTPSIRFSQTPPQPRDRRQDQHDIASQSPSPAVPRRSRDDGDVGVPLPARDGPTQNRVLCDRPAQRQARTRPATDSALRASTRLSTQRDVHSP